MSHKRTLENSSRKFCAFLTKRQKLLARLFFFFLLFYALNADMMAGAIATMLQP